MNRLPFGQKLVLITALASVTAWLLFGGALFYVSQQSIEEQVAEFDTSLAKDLMSKIDRSLFTAYQGIQVLSQDAKLKQLLLQPDGQRSEQSDYELSDHLEYLSLLTGPWRTVTVFDRRGRVVTSNMPLQAQQQLLSHPELEEALRVARGGAIYSSNLRLVGPDNAPSLIFAAPIKSQAVEGAEVLGVIVGQYAWTVINQILDRVNPKLSVQVIRDDGTVIATRSQSSQRIGNQAPAWARATALDNGVTALETSQHSDGLQIVARQNGYLSYEGKQWLLALQVPRSVTMAPVQALLGKLSLVALGGIVALCAVLYLASAYLTRPIKALSRAVESFSGGDISSRAPITSNDELADLGRTFNHMAEDIGFYIEELRENNREVRAFAYMVSHDLRSPLVNLQGFSSEIAYSLEELQPLLEPALTQLPDNDRREADEIVKRDIPEALQFIRSSVTRMDSQIQAVLTLSRMGRREMNWEEVDTQALVSNVLESLQHQLEAKDTEVTVDRLPVVEADAMALEQIFGNLVDNAVKYLDASPGHIEIWCTQERDKVTFHIRDNGPGIDPANVPKVFELFRRVGNTEVAGEGMGLAYVKTLVRRHGGRIQCKSQLGEGTHFSFSLARRPSALVRKFE
ncbi:sensor histidine kinase [Marinobacter halodurans]|uniref:histidine kinase n=1 Tax=Marinobacter halodurans TaxID=2528979 RepID=A0ABY1ZMH5_9GAMM|nr:sensor histidine kinase [Marinobacter halodurans]TBW57592.1 sensor histidine kinase [Marinobacter halodurans]